MTTTALLLVLGAAVTHASWNLLAKRAQGGTAFVWLFEATSLVLVAPFALAQIVILQPALGGVQVGFIAGSAVLQLVYTLLLVYGYRIGDLSLVYPLARGSGPLFATLGAVALFGERPTPLAIFGALLIVAGVILLTGNPQALAAPRAKLAVGCALLTGVMIAGYTLWDKFAVSTVQIPPIFYLWATTLGRVILLAPGVWRAPTVVFATWQTQWRSVLGVGALCPVAYGLVLTALQTSPVSYVAPTREIGILLGVLLGTRLLDEGHAPQRLAAAGAMVLGVVALAVG